MWGVGGGGGVEVMGHLGTTTEKQHVNHAGAATLRLGNLGGVVHVVAEKADSAHHYESRRAADPKQSTSPVKAKASEHGQNLHEVLEG